MPTTENYPVALNSVIGFDARSYHQMNSFLAELSAEKAGYVVGVFMGIVIFLGILAFAILALVKAFTKKTTGWIVAGSIGGLLVLIPTAIFVLGFIRGVSDVVRSRREMRGDSGAQLATRNSRSSRSQTIRGQEIAYSITVPADWIIQRRHHSFDVLVHYKSAYIGVIAEEANLGSPETIADIARGRIEEIGTDIQWVDPTPIVLDGRKWLEFSVNCRVKNVPLSYQYYVYAGTEGTFQIISWTVQNLASRDAPQMKGVSQTFLFPK